MAYDKDIHVTSNVLGAMVPQREPGFSRPHLYGLLVHSTTNVGDDIQSLAAMQFLPRVDAFIDRDATRLYKSPHPVKVIMNGWFTHKPENWPPSEAIEPLFVSFHLTPSAVERVLSEEGVAYLKRFAPIGTRDFFTQRVLEEYGIPAYFSGCLTLTLGNLLKVPKIKGQILIADLEPEAEKLLPSTLTNQAIRISNSHSPGLDSALKKLSGFGPYRAAKELIKVFLPKRSLEKLDYKLRSTLARGITLHHRLSAAMARLFVIASSEAVITSRLHVALPALGFGVPVLFIHRNLSDPRFEGLLPLLRHYDLASFAKEARSIDWASMENPSPQAVLQIKHQLIASIQSFLLSAQGPERGKS